MIENEDNEDFVIVVQPEVIVISEGSQGPQGRAGNDGAGAPTPRTAGATLSGHRAVYSSGGYIYYCDPSNPTQCALYLGITTQSGNIGDSIIVQRTGGMTDSSFSFSSGPIYLGANGTLTQVLPTSGSLFILGFAESATAIILDPQTPIIL